MSDKPSTVEQYIAQFPQAEQAQLKQVRDAVRAAAPDAAESISYGMPAYKTFGKPLVYFSGYPHHFGFYAAPSGHEEFAKDLARYKRGKGSVQFPLGEPMPLDLITRMTKFRVQENENNFG